MATEADINLANEMFNYFATGFDPGESGINFWANKIASQGYESALQEFLHPTDVNAPRNTVMLADPEYRLATGTTEAAGMTDEEFRNAMGLTGESNRSELDSSLRDWYNTYTGGKGMSIPVDTYVSMLNGRDGTYLSTDYRAAKAKMLDDAVKAGLYNVPAGSYSTNSYDSWVRQQTANKATIPAGLTSTTTTAGTTGGGATGGGGNTTSSVLDLFRLYATGYNPDQAAINFWNNKIAMLGYNGAVQEFLRPSDVNAPRNATMFADPDYIVWAKANNYKIPGTDKSNVGGDDNVIIPGQGNVNLPPGIGRFGGLNFLGTPIQPGFYSERGFEPNAIPFGKMTFGAGDARSLFDTYATGFTPDQTAIDFWNNKIGTLGYQRALNEFLNPSDINAPRNATMFQDPDYLLGKNQLSSEFIPPTTMPIATFRSGVAGYTPAIPTGFQFGVPEVLAPIVNFKPGPFDPGVLQPDGTWVPTASYEQQQKQQSTPTDSGI